MCIQYEYHFNWCCMVLHKWLPSLFLFIDPRFVMTFLLGYRHFTSTMELLSLLLARYPHIRTCMLTCYFLCVCMCLSEAQRESFLLSMIRPYPGYHTDVIFKRFIYTHWNIIIEVPQCKGGPLTCLYTKS